MIGIRSNRKSSAMNLFQKILFFMTLGLIAFSTGVGLVLYTRGMVYNTLLSTSKQVRIESYIFRILNCFKPDKIGEINGILVIEESKFSEENLNKCFNDNFTNILLELKYGEKRKVITKNFKTYDKSLILDVIVLDGDNNYKNGKMLIYFGTER